MPKRKQKAMLLKRKYAKRVDWSEEDGCFIGRCPGLFEGGIHGQDEAKVYAELCQAVEEWSKTLEPIPGVSQEQLASEAHKARLRVSGYSQAKRKKLESEARRMILGGKTLD